jgi:aryl-alcohol dehydrogenase-like predicted oxidoreductase
VAEVALAWVLRLPEMTSAIAGARSPEQIRQTALAGDLTLPADALAEIDAILAEREAA